MQVIFHSSFEKAFKKRVQPNPKLWKKIKVIMRLFQENPQNKQLRDHPLSGDKLGLRAFSVTGDIRIVYQVLSPHLVRFLDIGSHNQVY